MTTKKLFFTKLLALFFIVFTVNSCKKVETQNADKIPPEAVNTQQLKNTSFQIKSEGVIYKASDSYLKKASADFVKKINSTLKNPENGTASKSICGQLAGLSNVMQQVFLLPGSTLCAPASGQVEITYQTTIIEWDMPNPLIYTFTLEAGLLSSYTATSAVVSPNPVTTCDPNYPSCYTTYIYTVKFLISAADYVNSGNVLITATGTCPVTNAQMDLKEVVSLYFSNAYYLNNPAKIFINPGTGNFSVGTECALICHSPYVQCPSSGTFTYWQLPNGSPITITLSTSGAFNILAMGGPYGYSCQLFYGFGPSQINTGTFIVL